MLLLLDTDAFCVLAGAGLLERARMALGAAACVRLPALPHMLGRGSLRRRLGDSVSDALLEQAQTLGAVRAPSAAWSDRFVGLPSVDPGEAQLLAVAAEDDVLVVTGDKRALATVARDAGVAAALTGKVVLLEQVLDLLCELEGAEFVRGAVNSTGPQGRMLVVCFSPGNASPREALRVYVEEARERVEPLQLWTRPPAPGAAR